MKRKSYSNEIKALFIRHRNDGKTITWISEALKISFNTLKRWSTDLSKGKDIEDKRYLNGKEKCFSDEELKEYILNNENATLKDIGIHFSVSDVAILKRLKNANYSYKKKR